MILKLSVISKNIAEYKEYIRLRLSKIATDRCKLIDEEANLIYKWDWVKDEEEKGKGYDVLIIRKIETDEVTLIPSKEFLAAGEYAMNTAALWDYIKLCLDEFENFVNQLYNQANENENKWRQEIKESAGYQDYMSLKVQEKLDSK